MAADIDAQEVIRLLLLKWQEAGMCRVPARDGAVGIIQELSAYGYIVQPRVREARCR